MEKIDQLIKICEATTDISKSDLKDPSPKALENCLSSIITLSQILNLVLNEFKRTQ